MCPKDGRLTYKRHDDYDATVVSGTRSTYCYRFTKKALHIQLRQYSCYCRWCARCQYSKCQQLSVVRHNPDKPIRALGAGYRIWNQEGWRPVMQGRKSAPDPAVTRVLVQSAAAAEAYVSKQRRGATLAVRTQVDGSATFWLTSKESEIFPAPKSQPNLDIKKGEKIVKIVWYDRLSDCKYIRLDDISHIAVSSVLVTVSNIMWQRTTTNRYYLGDHTHNTLTDLVNDLSEL